MVVDGTDNFPTRYLVNDACVLLGKPNVYGSIFRFEGQASVFDATGRAVLPLPVSRAAAAGPRADVRGGRRARRAARASSASIQAIETIKLILGIGESLVGRLLLFDALAMQLPRAQAAQGPELPDLRRAPDDHAS